MQVRVLTLRYNEGIHRFPEQVIRDVTEGREILSMAEHFFLHGNVPHLALVLQLGESPEESSAAAGTTGRTRRARSEDIEAALPENRRGLFRTLREWRNRLAKTMDVAPFKIASNQQFVNIVNAAPRTAEELVAVEGVTKVFAEKYGEAVLRFVAAAGENAEGVGPQGEGAAFVRAASPDPEQHERAEERPPREGAASEAPLPF